MRLIRYIVFVALAASVSSAGIVGLTKDITAVHAQGKAITQVYANGVVWSGSTGGAWSPLDISDCVSWMDGADTATMYDSVSGGSLVANNGDIARWVDKSAGGNNWTNSGAKPQRTDSIKNGNSGVYFVSGDYLIAPNSADTDGTEFLVFNPLTDTGYILMRSLSNSLVYTFWALSGNVGAAQAANFGFPTWYKNGVYLGWKNLTNRDTAYTTWYNSWNVMSFSGADYSAVGGYMRVPDSIYSLTGYICESIRYNRVLDDAEREQVEAYLMDKWGIE